MYFCIYNLVIFPYLFISQNGDFDFENSLHTEILVKNLLNKRNEKWGLVVFIVVVGLSRAYFTNINRYAFHST